MKYFVTGGAGFIGSELVNQLLKEGNNVTVYDNLSLGKKKNLNEFKFKPNFKFIKGDILNIKKLAKSMYGHEFVYHLAANSDIKESVKDTKKDFQVNTIGTLNVLNSMLRNKIKQLAFTSTSAVFGIPTIVPTPENYGPSLPVSLYGASKLACEGFISTYSNLFQLKTWIFRLANITGTPLTLKHIKISFSFI